MPVADLNWKTLGFNYRQLPVHAESVWRDGVWSSPVLRAEPYLKMHIAATALHYGQEVFEGLKAFPQADGHVRVFRPDQNHRRLERSAARVMMPAPPIGQFQEMISAVLCANREWMPPSGTGATMYIRPLLIGTGPRIGVSPADEYTFLVLVVPVGPYYPDGFCPVRALVVDGHDRTAPRGMGSYKVGGNYAAAMLPMDQAKHDGFPITLFLDSRENRYIDEFGTSNFIGIHKNGHYVTPDSESILPSITNLSLKQVARDLGLTVDVRRISVDELGDFDEIGACGTAAVITPVGELIFRERTFSYRYPEQPGSVLRQLYDQLTGIQFGDLPDPHHWMLDIY